MPTTTAFPTAAVGAAAPGNDSASPLPETVAEVPAVPTGLEEDPGRFEVTVSGVVGGSE